MRLTLDKIQKTYGEHHVLDGLSLEAKQGEFLAVLGRSGCGKSTLLRIAGGFEPPDGGSVLLDGVPVCAPCKRVMMIFQDPNQLFPWMTLEQNIIYAVKKTAPRIDKRKARTIARECIAETGLAGFEGRYPHELSGGMKQRGALARALALQTDILLMDEPFSSLDYLTRKNAQETLARLWKRGGLSVVFVTHDIEEALTLATKIAVFDGETHRIGHLFENDGSTPDLKERLENLLLRTQNEKFRQPF